jgi:endonuclease YncB( thermonuclease family)
MRFVLPLSLLALSVALLVAVVAAPISAERSGGYHADIRALDGDTLEVDGTIIELYGIDAPELGQLCVAGEHAEPCGLQSAFALQKLVDLAIEPVNCSPSDGEEEDAGQVCRVGTDDLAHTLLLGGYATALEAASPGYKDAEDSAKQAGLGIWRMDFVSPAEWRAGRRLATEKTAGADACKIKGVITASGARVYYVPTDQGYDSIEADPAFDGSLMCSEELARLDGWRRP